MDYETRHAPGAALRERVGQTRTWLLANFTAPALREMAEDRHRPDLPVDDQPIRLPLGGDPHDAWATANAIARDVAR